MEKWKKICYYSNGDIYNGEWKNSKKNRKGIIVYKAEINMMEIGKMEKRVVKEFVMLKTEIFGMEKRKKKMGKEFFIIKIKIWKKKD